jgi:transposase-like protein
MGEKEEQEVLPMNELSQHPFKWRHFQSDIILLCVRWYLRSSLRYRDLGCVAKTRKKRNCSVNEGLQQKRKSVMVETQEYRFKET